MLLINHVVKKRRMFFKLSSLNDSIADTIPSKCCLEVEKSDDDFESKTVNRCLAIKMSAKFPALANKLIANLMIFFRFER